MHKDFLVFIAALLIIICSCKSGQVNNSIAKDQVVIENAIVVKSVGEEYEYVRDNCPGCQVIQQSLIFIRKKPYDVLEVLKPGGEKVNYYFDVSSFYGKW